MRHLFIARPGALARGALLALAPLLGGCGRDPATGPRPVAVALAIHGGDEQSGPAGSVLPEALQATATDGRSAPVPGATVRFRVTRGAATGTEVTDTIGVAGIDGVARTHVRLGSALDTSIVEGYLPGRREVIVQFRLVATPPPRLDAVVPSALASGDTVRLRGQYFNSASLGNTVYFGSARGRVVTADGDTSLTVVVPACIPSGTVATRVVSGTASTNTVNATSAGGPALLSLAPLEGVAVSGTELGDCLRLPADGATYLLVPQSAASSNGTRRIDYTLAVNTPGVVADVGPLLVPSGRLAQTGALPIGRRLDYELRRREAELVAEGGGANVPEPSLSVLGAQAAAAPPPVGSQRTFHVLSNVDGSTFRRATARLRYVGDHILIYVDAAAPAAGFTDADLSALGGVFDDTFYETTVRAFGAESDIDRNGRVIILLTPVVNAMTVAADCSTQGFVTGFFYGVDLLPTQRNSNRGEIFYSLVPDPNGTASCAHSKAQVERLVPANFVHEFQHMISFGQRVLARGGSVEALWLNEGLSHIAEELAGKHYEAKFPPPTGRTDPNQLFPDSAQGFLTPNVQNAQRYLAAPSAQSVTALSGSGRLEERGAAWLFLRWLGDQKGEEIFGRLVQTTKSGTQNVEDKAGETFAGLFGDFTTAVYTDSLPGVPRDRIPERLRFTSRNFRRMFQRLADIDQSGETAPFPITPRAIAPGQSASGDILQGSMTYLELTTRSGDPTVAVRFAPPGQVPFAPADLVQLGVFRLR